ncbi:MAG: sugar phosphate isomerase/epimerase, partial [Clostridia bacterium]|nr:sugar phosphate isomerase/epimerase [Clostridia bacterium]
MKLGVFTVVLGSMSLEDAICYLKKLDVTAIELGAGGYPGTVHLDAKKIFDKPEEIRKVKKLTEKYGMEISALSCHGNAVHPDKKIAAAFQEDFEKTVILAEKLGVTTVVTFSGCPGDHEKAKYPNWVTC